MKPTLIDLGKIGSAEIGYLSVVELEKIVPFPVKRVYWTYYTPNHIVRGNHAHRNLKQVLIAISGTIEFTFTDRAGNAFKFTLDHPSQGILVSPGLWRTMKFSHNAVLLCLASDNYDENDYIRNINDFYSET